MFAQCECPAIDACSLGIDSRPSGSPLPWRERGGGGEGEGRMRPSPSPARGEGRESRPTGGRPLQLPPRLVLSSLFSTAPVVIVQFDRRLPRRRRLLVSP